MAPILSSSYTCVPQEGFNGRVKIRLCIVHDVTLAGQQTHFGSHSYMHCIAGTKINIALNLTAFGYRYCRAPSSVGRGDPQDVAAYETTLKQAKFWILEA